MSDVSGWAIRALPLDERDPVPRYYFSIRYRGRVLPDREGVELGGDVDLEACASYLARRLRSEGGVAEVQFPGCVVEVADSRGELVLAVPLAPT